MCVVLFLVLSKCLKNSSQKNESTTHWLTAHSRRANQHDEPEPTAQNAPNRKPQLPTRVDGPVSSGPDSRLH
jgi:hypothetical protein